ALLAPTGTVRGPEHAGVPVHPANVATWAPDGVPSLTRTDTVALASLASTARLRVTVAVSALPPVTVAGVRVTDWMLSDGRVPTTFWVSVPAAPVVALTVAARLAPGLVAGGTTAGLVGVRPT